jgi:hypothetical protein
VCDGDGLLVAGRDTDDIDLVTTTALRPTFAGLDRLHGRVPDGHVALDFGARRIVLVWAATAYGRMFAGLGTHGDLPAHDIARIHSALTQLFQEFPLPS